MPKLPNQRHELFAQAIAKGMSNRDAYAKAGYDSEATASDASAARLLSDARVRARVDEILERAAIRTEATIEKTLTELARVAFADIRDVVEWKTTKGKRTRLVVKDSALLDDHSAAAIASVRQTKDGSIEVKMHDKIEALTLIGKHRRMFTERVEHFTTLSLAELVLASMEDATPAGRLAAPADAPGAVIEGEAVAVPADVHKPDLKPTEGDL